MAAAAKYGVEIPPPLRAVTWPTRSSENLLQANFGEHLFLAIG
jgi:hypothetical protein